MPFFSFQGQSQMLLAKTYFLFVSYFHVFVFFNIAIMNLLIEHFFKFGIPNHYNKSYKFWA